jgi:alkaline phosphatase
LGKIGGTVFTVGDHAYPDGTSAQFRNCYHPTRGKYKKRTRPSVGDHEYYTPGVKPYFDHFRGRACERRDYKRPGRNSHAGQEGRCTRCA